MHFIDAPRGRALGYEFHIGTDSRSALRDGVESDGRTLEGRLFMSTGLEDLSPSALNGSEYLWHDFPERDRPRGSLIDGASEDDVVGWAEEQPGPSEAGMPHHGRDQTATKHPS